ncbi:hypothetical protein C6988_09155, partial [Nitrosopumilus sp. b1]|uniref:hypothetical protein n=1 Tax=Nitrosopumilus sp. b1 TaxID=2109907 RepID=UPI001C714230
MKTTNTSQSSRVLVVFLTAILLTWSFSSAGVASALPVDAGGAASSAASNAGGATGDAGNTVGGATGDAGNT